MGGFGDDALKMGESFRAKNEADTAAVRVTDEEKRLIGEQSFDDSRQFVEGVLVEIVDSARPR
jgi:hypothetical protein